MPSLRCDSMEADVDLPFQRVNSVGPSSLHTKSSMYSRPHTAVYVAAISAYEPYVGFTILTLLFLFRSSMFCHTYSNGRHYYFHSIRRLQMSSCVAYALDNTRDVGLHADMVQRVSFPFHPHPSNGALL
jgi:hypothetical protein